MSKYNRLARTLLLLPLLIISLPTRALSASDYSSDTPSEAQKIYCQQPFDDTGKMLCGAFYDYYYDHFGWNYDWLPVSNELQEVSPIDGKTYTMQYFENSVMERPLDSQAEYSVTLSLLGVFTLREKYPPAQYPNGPPNQFAHTSDGRYFRQTGKYVGGDFLTYWNKQGDLEQLGLPLTNEIVETRPLTADPSSSITLTVQYFERAVLELHPEYHSSWGKRDSSDQQAADSEAADYTCCAVIQRPLGSMRYEQLYAQTNGDFIPASWPQARSFAQKTIAHMQSNALMKGAVDWQRVQTDLLTLPAEVPDDTYNLIYAKAKELSDHDHHSYFTDRNLVNDAQSHLNAITDIGFGLSTIYPQAIVDQVQPDSEAAKQGLRVGDYLQMINGVPTANMDAERFWDALYSPNKTQITIGFAHPGSDPTISATINRSSFPVGGRPKSWALPFGLGYVALPAADSANYFTGNYASILQTSIGQVDGQSPRCGWVVDLRPDVGGDARPMLLGIGPILGEGNVGTYQKDNGASSTTDLWSYNVHPTAGGVSSATASVGSPAASMSIARATVLANPNPPVAVLTGHETASSGELIAVAFRQRSLTRSFGEKTKGQTSNNSTWVLADGSVLNVASHWYADRMKRAYKTPVIPEQPVTGSDTQWICDGNNLCDNLDPMVSAAVAWLRTQPGCK